MALHFLTSTSHQPCSWITMIRYGFWMMKSSTLGTLKKADWSGIATMALGLGCLEVVLEEGNREEWFSSSFYHYVEHYLCSELSLLLSANELQHKKPLVNLRLLRNGQFGDVLYRLPHSRDGVAWVYLRVANVFSDTDSAIQRDGDGEVLMWMPFPQLLIFPIVPVDQIIVKYLVTFGFAMFGFSCYVVTTWP